MKIIDITHELSEKLKIYKGDPPVHIERLYSLCDTGFAITKIKMGSHSGTHIDAPSHFIEGGKNVDEIPLSGLLGECAVIEYGAQLEVPKDVPFVIIKNGSGGKARLTEAQAAALVDAGIRLVGTEELSIGSDIVHKTLLVEGIAILEYLNLERAAPGRYFLCALPLKIKADGAPVRACLLENMNG